MRKLFTYLAAATVLMVIITGLSIYWLANSEITKAKENSGLAEAKNVALGLATQIKLLNSTLDKMSQDPDVISAISLGNPGLLNETSTKLEKFIPNIMKIRLLLPDTNGIDEQAKPHMGFADLDLVRETLKGNQFPGVQGENGGHRHLAVARGISQNGKIIGVILASFNENLVIQTLHLANIQNGYIELKQGAVVLGTMGQKDLGEPSMSQEINVANTDWSIQYQSWDTSGSGNSIMILSIVLALSLISLVAFFIAYQWLSNTLRQDLDSIMKAFKDIMTRNSQSNYPTELSEFTATISNLMQFKRVLDYSDQEPSEIDNEVNIIVNDDDDFDIEGLFDDVKGFKF